MACHKFARALILHFNVKRVNYLKVWWKKLKLMSPAYFSAGACSRESQGWGGEGVGNWFYSFDCKTVDNDRSRMNCIRQRLFENIAHSIQIISVMSQNAFMWTSGFAVCQLGNNCQEVSLFWVRTILDILFFRNS